MLARIPSATLHGVDGRSVSVEVHVSSGLPGFTVVGLPDAAVRESRDRVRAALLSSQLSWPSRRVTVNLAPSGVRKTGAGLDLPIAIGLLVAADLLPAPCVEGTGFVGELGLDGSCPSHSRHRVARRRHRRRPGRRPGGASAEAALVAGERVRPASSLAGVVAALRGRAPWEASPTPAGGHSRCAGARPPRRPWPAGGAPRPGDRRRRRTPSVVRGRARLGQDHAGYPPAGDPPRPHARRVARGVAHPFRRRRRARPADRSRRDLRFGPRITVPPRWRSWEAGRRGSDRGRSRWPMPGSCSSTSSGSSRPPSSMRCASPSRSTSSGSAGPAAAIDFPARFVLVGAMNPCPCGEGGSPGACRCSDAMRRRYLRRLVGAVARPLRPRHRARTSRCRGSLGRPAGRLLGGGGGAGSTSPGARARPGGAVQRRAPLRRRSTARRTLSADAAALLERRLRSGALSARGLHRVRRVAQTIADLDGAAGVGERQVAEALQLRSARSVLVPGAQL